MRVAIVTESFLPQVNGVTNTVRQVVEHLGRTGHEALVVAPGPGPTEHAGARVVRVRSMGLPGYRSFQIGLPTRPSSGPSRASGPTSSTSPRRSCSAPSGLRAARRLGIPTVAVYQTDVAGFARQYRLRADIPTARWVGRLHRRATRTLAPSRSSYAQLEAMGVPNVHLWRRGVSLDLFGPGRRSEALRATWTESVRGPVVVGYVGRLAAEKQVRRLRDLAGIPGVRLVAVGDGPERGWLERHLPGARFTGMLGGEELATAFASLDVFVHPGEAETFCQTVQEAQASGVPVVAAAAAAPSTWWPTAAPGCSSTRATRPRCRGPSRPWSPMPACAAGSRTPRSPRSPGAAGPTSSASWSTSTTAGCSAPERPRPPDHPLTEEAPP